MEVNGEAVIEQLLEQIKHMSRAIAIKDSQITILEQAIKDRTPMSKEVS